MEGHESACHTRYRVAVFIEISLLLTKYELIGLIKFILKILIELNKSLTVRKIKKRL